MNPIPNWKHPGLYLIAAAIFVSAAGPSRSQSEALYLEGDLFLQSDLGAFEIGFPNNGNQWRIATIDSGANLIFRQKPSGMSGFNNRFYFGGSNGYLGIGDIATAKVNIFQGGQSVGLGLRFDDGVNSDWDITHGFGLRLHYGGSLRGFFNATTGEYSQSSDRQLKVNIRPMPSVLSRVERLEPSLYQMTGQADDRDAIGFVAQDILPLFPELVTYSEADALYGVNYSGFSVVAIRAIQELQEDLRQRDRKIDELEQRIAGIERLLQN
jgi:hypothetical protein